jgi:poly(A) polymerase
MQELNQKKSRKIMVFEQTNHLNAFDAATDIAKILQNAGFAAFFVGGAVRDMLLGHAPKDIDLATSATTGQVEALFQDCQTVGACFGVMLVRHHGHQFEVATFRLERNYLDGRRPEDISYTDDPEIDARRRDFTVNAMFYDPAADKTLDFFGGQDDLRRGIIRTVGDPSERFSEDYLRMLRAVRFASKLNFTLEKATAAAIKNYAGDTAKLAAERIREELDLMLTGPAPARAVKLLFELDILAAILPEVAAMDGVEQPEKYHPEGDVMVHTLLMLDYMKLSTPELAWSILLHDVGKPVTRFIDENGTARFFGHETVGAEMTEHIMDKLRHSKEMTAAVSHAVRNHMRFAHVDKMRTAKWRRMMSEEMFPMELELHRIDCMASHGKVDNYLLLLDRLSETGGETELPPPLLNGRDLIAVGLKPGPYFGEILRAVGDLQLSGELNSKDDALKYLAAKVNY